MDDNTFKFLGALIASIQVIVLAWLAIRQSRSETKIVKKVDTVHELVNGLAHEKEVAITQSAIKEGEMLGRDYAAAKKVTHDNARNIDTAALLSLLINELDEIKQAIKKDEAA